jgi:membrane associated rhomboid family serine protease
MTASSGAGQDVPAMPADYCYRHPMRETLIHCTRCDRPICPECMRPAAVGFHCPDDVKLAGQTVRVPKTSVGAAVGLDKPWVTWGLIAVNVAMYLATGLRSKSGFNNPATSWLFQQLELSPQDVRHGDYYRLLTSAFLHLSVLHIVANMLALAIIGPPIERLLGRWRFLALYLLGALGGGLAVYAFDSVYTVVAGASGAIYALFAAAVAYMRELRLDPRWLIGTIVLNFVLSRTVPGISLTAHIGGFVTGLVVAVALSWVPWQRRRLGTLTQLAGLGGLLMVIVVGVAWRTAVLG